jgi:hypothetical protein
LNIPAFLFFTLWNNFLNMSMAKSVGKIIIPGFVTICTYFNMVIAKIPCSLSIDVIMNASLLGIIFGFWKSCFRRNIVMKIYSGLASKAIFDKKI